LTGWTILLKPSSINQRLGWWNSVGDFDPCMFHNYHSSFFSTKDLGGRGKSHNLFNASPSTVRLDHSAENFFYQPNTWMMKLMRRFLCIERILTSACPTTITENFTTYSMLMSSPTTANPKAASPTTASTIISHFATAW
jgi:hypothetical protein